MSTKVETSVYLESTFTFNKDLVDGKLFHDTCRLLNDICMSVALYPSSSIESSKISVENVNPDNVSVKLSVFYSDSVAMENVMIDDWMRIAHFTIANGIPRDGVEVSIKKEGIRDINEWVRT